MKLQINEKLQADSTLVIPAWENFELNSLKTYLPNNYLKAVENWIAKNEYSWKKNSVESLNFIGSKEDMRVVLIGLGSINGTLTHEDIQNLFGLVYSFLSKNKIKDANVIAEHLFNNFYCHNQLIKLTAQTLTEAAYNFDTFKEKKNDYQLNKIILIASAAPENLNKLVQDGIAFGEAVNVAKQLVNEPANEMTPRKLAEMAQKTGNSFDFEVKVYDEKKIAGFGMEAFISVAKGSDNQPRLIVMHHKGNPDNPTDILGLIGKGLTFDTGGYNLKPGEGMGNMKNDMGGAAAVIGAMAAIAHAKLPVNVTAVVAACENMISGRAYRPGDIIGSMAGKTIEIISTDAEGRLTLIDAVQYAIKHERVSKIIDVATLTGAAVVALGGIRNAVVTNERSLYETLSSIEKYSNEKFWLLPDDPEYAELNKSDVADIKNSGGRWGGAIAAGLFIREFVQDHPWMHIDIAGTAMTEKPKNWQQKGGTGNPVKSLFYFVKELGKDNPVVEKKKKGK
jgi:leucyl aminopeptidase